MYYHYDIGRNYESEFFGFVLFLCTDNGKILIIVIVKGVIK